MNFNQYPDRRIDNTEIYEFPAVGNAFLIGHTINWCNDLENAYNEALLLLAQNQKEKDEYFGELVKHGHRVKPKTQEDINAELAQALQASTELTKTLMLKIEKQEETAAKLASELKQSLSTHKENKKKEV